MPKKYSEDASGKEKEGLELLLSQYANKLSHVLEEEMKHKIKIHEMEQEIRRLKGQLEKKEEVVESEPAEKSQKNSQIMSDSRELMEIKKQLE